MQISKVNTDNLIQEIELKINYTFKDKQLLIDAFTHSSYLFDFPKAISYERLEFLGDALLNLCISEQLYNSNSNKMNEGKMSKARSKIISEAYLYECAKSNDFIKFIRLGKSLKSETQVSVSIAADVVEAIIGAVFLDSDYENTCRIVLKIIDANKFSDEITSNVVDYKSNLQEYIQKKHSTIPIYDTIGSRGPDHKKLFVNSVTIKEEKIFESGEGKTKKEAEQNAAKAALERLGLI